MFTKPERPLIPVKLSGALGDFGDREQKGVLVSREVPLRARILLRLRYRCPDTVL